MRIYWLCGALLAGVLLAVLNNYFASVFFLYWRFPWTDLVAHTLGGVAIGSFLISILPARSPRTYLAVCLGVFVGWEVFEYVIGAAQPVNYRLDTEQDLLMDAVGAVITYVAARLTIWKLVP